ncbi:CAAX prenyl protease 2 isoform X1 [Cardiocondyla obscurior]|uniref:CAAX prenyl protease 2 isoform X1 n=2 Tax=Cardiocondyla obscurior TaxID=286306 RepID=UPI0039657E97
MEAADRSTDGSAGCATAILACLALSTAYVASLYVWSTSQSREHPSTIKKRFFSVFVMTFVSPAPLYFVLNNREFQQATIWEMLGLRWTGLVQATVIPLVLTMILFLGPLSLQGFSGLWRLYTDFTSDLVEPMYWLISVQTLTWWRNQVVAPLSEEWTFRACMLPLLLQCFTPTTAIFVCPLFFGIAHFHHIVERVKMGVSLKHALLISCFQSAYTTLFGAYAAFLFVRTGHFIAPFAAHSFCNHMGFPDLSEIAAYKDPLQRVGLICLFVIGLIAWCLLLMPMTHPSLFNNNLFWTKYFI